MSDEKKKMSRRRSAPARPGDELTRDMLLYELNARTRENMELLGLDPDDPDSQPEDILPAGFNPPKIKLSGRR